MKNRLDADHLVDLRAEISRLQADEQQTRERIIASGENVVTGDENVAVVTQSEWSRLDMEALRRALGDEVLQRFMRKTTVIKVRTFRLKGPSRAEWAMLKKKEEH
jgi:hypothetical protein